MSMLLGFDIGGTKCAAILGKRTPQGAPEILGKKVFQTREYPTPLDCIGNFVKEMKALLTSHHVSQNDIAALGISCGGPLDSKTGTIQSPPNLPGWDDIPIVEILKKDFSCPILLQNDANAGAVAEWKFGAGMGTQNMIFMTFGTGLGAGLILDGHLYSGTNDMAGECGHVRLEADGPVGYGKTGSFEGFCSGSGIAQLAKKHLKQAIEQGNTPSWFDGDFANVNAKIVGQAADTGDELALEIYRDCGRHLGIGLSILIDILNPEKIVIGSIFTRSENLLRAEMQKVIDREALPQAAKVCQVVPAKLNENIGDFASLAIAESIA